MMFVLPTGAFDPKRHADSLAAAQAELSEEVRDSGYHVQPCVPVFSCSLISAKVRSSRPDAACCLPDGAHQCDMPNPCTVGSQTATFQKSCRARQIDFVGGILSSCTAAGAPVRWRAGGLGAGHTRS